MRILLITLMTSMAVAATGVAAADTDEDIAAIAEQLPGIPAESISPSPVEGLFQVRVGSQIAYISRDGRFAFQGDIIELQTNVNLTEQARVTARADTLADIDEASMVIFEPEDVKYTVTVFTDIDCGYCRKLHSEMSQLNDYGIRVRYLFYPRSGPGTDSWFKAEDVWCSDNQQDSLTRAKLGETVESDDCGATPVADHFSLGQDMGVRGTPFMIGETGDAFPGYLPAPVLLEELSNAMQAP